MLVSLLIALPLGSLAGYFGGAIDAVVSQLTETIMAFPLLLFLLFANRYLISDFRSVGWSWVMPDGAPAEALLIGVFTAFYPTRLIRAELFSLRHAEFVEAAHMVGASNWRILRRHLLPHLAPTLLVWGAIAVGTNILAEVGLSFLGVGVQASVPTLGSLLSTVWGTIFNPQTYNSQVYTPWQTVFPMVAIVVTVVSLNRLSEALRRAMEPRETRVRIASYLLGRSVRGVLTLLTMIAIGFALYFAVERQPPVADYFPTVQKGAPATKQQTDLVRHLFYLDRSKVGMYFTYLGHLAEGDLGHTKAITLDAARTDTSLTPDLSRPTRRFASPSRSSLAGQFWCFFLRCRSERSREPVSVHGQTAPSHSGRSSSFARIR